LGFIHFELTPDRVDVSVSL